MNQPIFLSKGPQSNASDLEVVNYDALKGEYLCNVGAVADVVSGSLSNLRRIVAELLKCGVKRSTLIRWGIEAGYSARYIRSLLSKVGCDNGQRVRQPGAGPEPPKEVVEIRADLRRKYGAQREIKLLRAALYDATQEAKAKKAQSQTENRTGCGPSLVHVYRDPSVSAETLSNWANRPRVFNGPFLATPRVIAVREPASLCDSLS